MISPSASEPQEKAERSVSYGSVLVDVLGELFVAGCVLFV
jgi:hypothetical protein